MSAKDPETEYAFWVEPGSEFKITYSLGVFHEIDFQVNEGYRRIPHGGIEVGGLLFGTGDERSVQIEAFRSIECEHASGPSFVLSERDVAGIRQQIANAKSDPDLEGFDVLGWFVAHTRSPLKMNDREAALFNELIPGAGKIMVLIKPERFQPTRFGFLVRGENGKMERDATSRAIILPLPGRATRSSNGPVPSISAPVEKPSTSTPVSEPVPQQVLPLEPAPLPQAGLKPPVIEPPVRPQSVPEIHMDQAVAKTEVALPPRKSAPEPPAAPPVPLTPEAGYPARQEVRTRRVDTPAPIEAVENGTSRHQPTRKIRSESKASNTRLAVVLFFAAALGCGVGYLAYLQLPSPLIVLTADIQPSGVTISWPPEQTRDAVYAAIRVDDGQQIPLSQEQKSAGHATIKPSGDNVKIEIIAQHWMRDSRGILRFIKPPSPPPVQAAPPVSPPAQQ